MSKFTSKIEKISGMRISFYNGITLSVGKKTLVDKAVELFSKQFVEVTVENGMIIDLKQIKGVIF